jgi:hypothetical protein
MTSGAGLLGRGRCAGGSGHGVGSWRLLLAARSVSRGPVRVCGSAAGASGGPGAGSLAARKREKGGEGEGKILAAAAARGGRWRAIGPCWALVGLRVRVRVFSFSFFSISFSKFKIYF